MIPMPCFTTLLLAGSPLLDKKSKQALRDLIGRISYQALGTYLQP